MSKGLDAGTEALEEFFRGGIEGHKNTNVHAVGDFLGAKTLEVLANSSVRLSKFVWLKQNFLVESKEGLIRQEDCSLIDQADSSQHFRKVEALDSHRI